MIYQLKVKQQNSNNPNVVRTFKKTVEACDNLNAYLEDFFESILIIQEDISAGKITETESLAKIDFMKRKIKDISESMKAIASAMPDLAEIEKIENKKYQKIQLDL